MVDTHNTYKTTGVFTAPQNGTYQVKVGNDETYTVKLPAGYSIDVRAFGTANTQLKEPTMTTEERKTLNKSSKKKLIERIKALKSSAQAYQNENHLKNQTITNLTHKNNELETDNLILKNKLSKTDLKISDLKQAIKALSDCL